MMSSKLGHIVSVILYVIGITGAISGGATFHFRYNNNAASLWAGVSVVLLLIGLLQELFKHNDSLHICHTPLTLAVCQILSVFMALFLAVLTVLHFIVAYNGEEALENMEFNDYIVGIWTLYCLKCAIGLSYSSHKCRKRLKELEGLRARAESPNFLSGGPSVPYEQLNAPGRFLPGHATSRSHSLLDDESVATEDDSVTTGGQFAAGRAISVVSDETSALDMDHAAEELETGTSAFSNSRLVVT